MNKEKEKRRYQRWGRGGLLTFVFSFLILVCGCGFAKQSGDILFSTEDTASASYSEEGYEGDEREGTSKTAAATEQKKEQLAVYVCGAVNQPGVYELTEGARVVDALNAAGGCRSDAALEYWNQAEYVEDGQKLYVPTVKEAEQLKTETVKEQEETKDASGRININQADLTELMTLPGIGEAKAQAIIEYRTEHGRFNSIEELKNISGIKDGVYNKVKDSITVG